MADYKEIAFNNIEGEKAWTVSASQRKWITKIKKAAVKYPNQVVIKHTNKDGSLVAEFPDGWLKFSPKRVISEKNREASRKRMTEFQSKA